MYVPQGAVAFLDNIKQWHAWLQTNAEAIVTAAAGTPLGGGPEWDALLAGWGVAPLPQEERQRHLSVGPPRRSGPSPIEVRSALEALRRKADEARAQLQAAADNAPGYDEAAEREIDALARLSDGLVDSHVKQYVARVRPAISTSSIFANAAASSRTYGQTAAGMNTLICDCCGAPRRKGADARTCEFCGSPF